MQVKITPSPLAGTVQLPPSKSFAIRALICSALAGGGSVAPLGTSADIAATVQALADLAAGRDEIFCNESGSLVRFLIPVAAAYAASDSVIKQAESINKTYPAFFEDFCALGGKADVISNR